MNPIGVLVLTELDGPSVTVRAGEGGLLAGLELRLAPLGSFIEHLEVKDVSRLREGRQLLKNRGARRCFAIGFGRGAVYALMAGSVAVGFDGIVGFDPPMVLPTLSSDLSIQPMDLIPGLHCPVQLHFSTGGPTTPEQVEVLRRRLVLRTIIHQIYLYPGVSQGYCASADSRVAWVRSCRFLAHLAGMEVL